MANVQRERMGITKDQLLQVYNGGGLTTDTQQLPLVNPVGTPEQAPPADQPSNTAPINKEADNSLLIFGGLALFAAIAFTGKRSVSGPDTPSPKWLLPAALVGGAILWFKFKQPSQEEKLNAIMVWVDQQPDTPERKDFFVTQVRTMAPDELDATWDYLIHYVSKGIPLPDASPLRSKISAIRDKYQIFT